ncbi:MAG: hypothetical protein ACRCTI_21440 [Beijerinckiaceae bacterium]
MTYMEMPRRQGRSGAGRRVERFEMKALVLLTYPLFLAVAVLSRALALLGLRRPRFGAVVRGAPVSVFAEARQTAEATIPLAFRG